MLKHLLPVFGATTLARVMPKELAAYNWRRHQAGSAPATVVKALAFMKAAFDVAIREWGWCRDNPVCRVSMAKVNNARARYCDDQTLARIYQAYPEWQLPVVMVARYTGLRRDNVVSLQWSQVHLAQGIMVLDRTKNGDRLGFRCVTQSSRRHWRTSSRLGPTPAVQCFSNATESRSPGIWSQLHFGGPQCGRSRRFPLSRLAAYARVGLGAAGRGSLHRPAALRSSRWTLEATLRALVTGEFA